MLKQERLNEIMQILGTQEFVSVKKLSKMLYASESSIRRDLSRLEKMGIARRKHGGAERVLSHSHISPFTTRSYDFAEAKKQIALKALGLISEGSVVFLDQSTTAYFLASFLQKFQDLTVVTNNIEIVNLLANTNLTVHCTGGVISKNNPNCLLGTTAQNTFSRICADIMFFSTKSLSENGVITDCYEEEIGVRNTMLQNAAQKVFLCDSSKIGTISPYVQCSLAEADIMVSEDNAGEIFQCKFSNLRIL